MIYKEFQDLKLPALGVGMMRLPVKGQGETPIDEERTAEMIAYAMGHGVNYFDTAYGYHESQSEVIAGRLLTKYPRDSYYLADKFPGYDLANMDKVEEIFEEQLKRCQTDYFDFYMFHNVCEMNVEQYLDETYGILTYLLEQKAAGRIRCLGFSAHGGYDVMKRFLDSCGEEMEFCQIQLNYLDWKFQDAKAKVELLKEYGIPLWVMEPLRGGALVSLSKESEGKLKALRPEEEIPAWAFRFLQSLPQTVVTLSGMSNFEQIKANIATFSEEKPLEDHEMRTLLEIADEKIKSIGLPCTKCGYCVSHCPQKLDIPKLLELYNEHRSTEHTFGFIAPMALAAQPEEKHPKSCVGCGSCEAVCPQQLKIADAMADFAQKLK
ncbi:MAG: 4Fe-4S dicluster domain-containing protein [Firmicutes bacterium]|jgi:predicted aldo/keto reductase-like oxidoreductase|nr:4Fe-4S dicluster domain-containing protein [Bacillota bacterium]NBI62864.1 4Fe-4S dicluster domain-containing protein [Clostridiales bacterium]